MGAAAAAAVVVVAAAVVVVAVVVVVARAQPPQLLQHLFLQDLNTGINVATVAHSDRLDWLELNRHGKYVLFRDKQRRLHLVNVATQERTTLLLFCSYVQWVPDTDVVIAQVRAGFLGVGVGDGKRVCSRLFERC